MITQTFDGQAYEVFSADEINGHLFLIAKKILGSGEKIDRVVALARGGVSIAQSLSDLIGVKKISIIQSEMYSGVYETAAPIITQPLAANIKGESILLIDDLADSGETLLFAKQYLSAHGPFRILTATLASKPWTKVTPDFYALSSDAWVIFPWEVRETIETLTAIWTKKDVKKAEITKRLEALGYSALQIETFSKI